MTPAAATAAETAAVMKETVDVRATTRAWHLGQRVWPGDIVALRDGADVPPWAQPVELDEPTAPPVKKRRRRKPAPKTEQETDNQ